MTEETLEKLAQLLEQDQFELLIPEKIRTESGRISDKASASMDIPLVYLMNDAVESFLVFRNVRMTGEYHSDYQGELQASMARQDGRFVLVIKQDDTVLTLFFEDLELEVHLYEYAYTGHFWVKDYEYLRQLEYRLAILRDKYDYLGEAYCTEEEIKLAALVEFPPLNYCCYPAVPEKYIVPRENPWIPSEKAIVYMKELAAECEDTSLLKMLEFYRKHPAKFWAKRLAVMLHQTKHSRIVDLLSERLQQATADYPRRFFGDDMERKYQQALERAKQRQRELKSQGIRADLLREEPFTIARDSLNYKLYLMIWKEQKGNRVTEIEEYIFKAKAVLAGENLKYSFCCSFEIWKVMLFSFFQVLCGQKQPPVQMQLRRQSVLHT